MTTANIRPVVDKFNKRRSKENKIDVTRSDYEFIIRRESDKVELGRIYYRGNYSNCGLGDLHNLSANTQTNASLVLKFIKFYAKCMLASVLLYNTADGQKLVEKALEDTGFHTVEKKFKNKGSGRSMVFHMVQLR